MLISKTDKYKYIIREEDLLQSHHFSLQRKTHFRNNAIFSSPKLLGKHFENKELRRILYMLHRLLTPFFLMRLFVIILPARQTKLRSNVDWYYGVQLLQEGLPVTDVMQHGLSMKS
jgi:hypothetical protein